jgi:hypothetical protein
MNKEVKTEIVNTVKEAAPVVLDGVKTVACSLLTIAAKTVKYVAEQVVEILEPKK